MKAEIEKYPLLDGIIEELWKMEEGSSSRYLFGIAVAYLAIGEAELHQEVNFLCKILEIKGLL